jgi:rhomboid family GlyGly-CTERM serine protease
VIDSREQKMTSVAETRRGWRVLATLGVVALGAQLGGESVRSLARYERAGLEAGEIWRLATAHVVHLGWGHLLPNLLALGLIGGIFNDVLKARDWALIAAASATAIDIGLYFLDPNIDWYVGLSGVLHGFVAGGALALLLTRQSFGLLLGVGLAAKLAFEQAIGPLPFSSAAAGGSVVVAAHLYGSVGGLAAYAATHLMRRNGSQL